MIRPLSVVKFFLFVFFFSIQVFYLNRDETSLLRSCTGINCVLNGSEEMFACVLNIGFKSEDLNAPKSFCLFREVALTLRRLMSYIYIYIYMEHPFLMFLDHTQRRSTVSRTPLDE